MLYAICFESLDVNKMKILKWSDLSRRCLMVVQLVIIALTMFLIALVISKRKCKTISSSMWTLLVTIIVGSLILDFEVLLQYLTPSVPLCLTTTWMRELGFVILYGAIDLKLYRILMQFRTRKAHCWTIRDKDLLRYLSFAVIVVIVYLASWTAVSLNFKNEGCDLLIKMEIGNEGSQITCKPQWWNHVTEFGELMILTVGLYYGYSARNAHVPFNERHYLFYALTVELTFSSIFYAIRYIYPIPFHQGVMFSIAVIRGLLTNFLVLLIILVPKVFHQKKLNAELRNTSMNQELTENLGNDLADNEIRELNIGDMTPDEIRDEFIRIYTQIGLLKDKTIRKKNPHISKRKGGKKLPHRRFSLQSSMKSRKKFSDLDSSEVSETNETNEISKSSEDSVVSNEEQSTSASGYEGPSYRPAPKTYQKIIAHEHEITIDNVYGEGPSSSYASDSV